MERVDDGQIKQQQQTPSSDNDFSLAATTAAASWPPASATAPPQVRSSSSSSYTCGYCKKEFRSAQGLGGHMNVHRLDRARLIHQQYMSHSRSIAPPPNNPNPSCTVLDLGLSLSSLLERGDDGGCLPTVPLEKLGNSRFSSTSSAATTHDYSEEGKNLELRIGACSHGGDDTEERLDLQLRLGYSSVRQRNC